MDEGVCPLTAGRVLAGLPRKRLGKFAVVPRRVQPALGLMFLYCCLDDLPGERRRYCAV